jgi:hypothetical protein
MRHCLTLPFLLVCTLPVYAAETSLDSALDGFDEPATESSLDAVLDGFTDTTSEKAPESAAITQKPWTIGGAVTLGTAYNFAHSAPATGETDYRGLSRLRSKLNIEFDYDIAPKWRTHIAGYGFYDAAYQINGRDNYSSEVLDAYESETELGEAWLQGKLTQSVDLKLGRQIVVWGKSDNIRVTDIINPLDNREPGMVDIEDLRLPLTMARLDYYIGDWGLTALAIPEIRFNKNPAFGSDFYPYPTAMPKEITPADGGNHTEYAFAANGIFSGWDLSLYWAQLYDDTPHRVMVGSTPQLQHSRLTMTGLAANAAVDNWLLKAELAYFDGLEYSSLPGQSVQRMDTLLGVEYSGFSETTLSLEVVNRHVANYDSALLSDGIVEDEWQTALRYQGDFMHARLHLLALLSAFGDDLADGGFSRYSAAYDIADALTVTGGIVTYQEGNKLPFGTVYDNDRLFVDLKYSF